jgi:hypothetical protein
MMDCEREAVVAAESLQDMASGLVYSLKPNGAAPLGYDVIRSERNSVQNSQDSNAYGYGDFEEVQQQGRGDKRRTRTRARSNNRRSNAQHSSHSKAELSSAAADNNHMNMNMVVAGGLQKAFLSVHDMIHASIEEQGSLATLRGIYKYCQTNGRIVYKRSGGSRLITDNEHWKSQIRHALYTSGRFVRNEENSDLWELEKSYKSVEPQVTLLPIGQGQGQAMALNGTTPLNQQQHQNETSMGMDHSVNVKQQNQRSSARRVRRRSRAAATTANTNTNYSSQNEINGGGELSTAAARSALEETSNRGDLASVVNVPIAPKRKRSERGRRGNQAGNRSPPSIKQEEEKKTINANDNQTTAVVAMAVPAVPVVPVTEATATTVPIGSALGSAAHQVLPPQVALSTNPHQQIPLEFWSQNIINSQQITQSVNMIPGCSAMVPGQNQSQNPNPLALQNLNAMSILTLLGSVVQSQSISTGGQGGQGGYSPTNQGQAQAHPSIVEATASAANKAAMLQQLEEESVYPVTICKGLKPEHRMALLSILHQCDPKVGESFQDALQREDAQARVAVGGMTKLMFRTFLNSLNMGLTISASGASEHHLNPNDTASSDITSFKKFKSSK